MAGWLVGVLVGWLVGWLAGWLAPNILIIFSRGEQQISQHKLFDFMGRHGPLSIYEAIYCMAYPAFILPAGAEVSTIIFAKPSGKFQNLCSDFSSSSRRSIRGSLSARHMLLDFWRGGSNHHQPEARSGARVRSSSRDTDMHVSNKATTKKSLAFVESVLLHCLEQR